MTPPDAPLWTRSDLAGVLGLCPPNTPVPDVTGVSIDTRSLQAGDLFVALSGERTDGHDHVTAAFKAGAAAALVSRPVSGAPQDRLLIVPDVMVALCALARAARTRFEGRLVGLTGSVGKTSTKEMLKLALEKGLGLTVHATVGNLNNHIGVPLTLARMPRKAEVAVIEMGMNHAGEIADLTRLARPHVALITTISPAHLEFFDGLEAIARAKAEILDGLEPGGLAVLNRDGPFFDLLCACATRHAPRQVIRFGTDPQADIRLVDYTLDAGRSRVVIETPEGALSYDLPVEGLPWILNSLGVMAVVQALGFSLQGATKGFSHLVAPNGRGRRQTIRLENGVTFQLIDESYNASPDSVAAALATLAIVAPQKDGRRIAVLGDMLELGPQEIHLHTILARSVVDHGIDVVYTVGFRMAHLFDALPADRRGVKTPDAHAMGDILKNAVRDGDVMMIKGSHASHVYRLVDHLLALNAEPSAPVATNDP